jgi:hypothetical protein
MWTQIVYAAARLMQILHCLATQHFARLLRAMEEAHVNGLAEDVSLYRFQDVRASLECVRAGLDVDLRV